MEVPSRQDLIRQIHELKQQLTSEREKNETLTRQQNVKEDSHSQLAMFVESRKPYPIRSEADIPPNRVHVEDSEVPWATEFNRPYDPPDFTTREVMDAAGKWADQMDSRAIKKEDWTQRQKKSVRAFIDFDAEGRPRNPIGRTGLRGRGSLAKWGPNFASDIVVTRWKPNETGILEVLARPHKTLRGKYSMLGATLDNKQDFAKRELDKLVRVLTGTGEEMQAKHSQVAEKIDAILKLDGCKLEGGSGYVDDPRSTDNAWIESTFYHLHLDTSLLQKLGLDEEPALCLSDAWASGFTSDEPTWITLLEDNAMLARVLGEHKEMAFKARKKMMPPYPTPPLATSRLVMFEPAPRNLMADLALRKPPITHITGLVDEHNCERLLNSLWADAGKPTYSARKFPDDNEDAHKFMMDRCNWSIYNLHELIKNYEKLGYQHPIQALTALQRFCSSSYRTVLSLPVNMLSLCACNNVSPYTETVIPTDQLECLSHGQQPTWFHLDTKVFDSGSMLVSRDTLQKIKRYLQRQRGQRSQSDRDLISAAAVRPDDSDNHHLELQASPLSAITFDDRGRELAGIPETAVFFCISYPHMLLESNDWLAQLDEQNDERDKALYDPFLCFLTVGAYLYFDMAYKIVGISALCFRECPEWFVRNYNRSGVLRKLYYGRPSKLPKSTIRPVIKEGRWRKVTVPDIQTYYGFQWFTWIKPSEFLGDHVGCTISLHLMPTLMPTHTTEPCIGTRAHACMHTLSIVALVHICQTNKPHRLRLRCFPRMAASPTFTRNGSGLTRFSSLWYHPQMTH